MGDLAFSPRMLIFYPLGPLLACIRLPSFLLGSHWNSSWNQHFRMNHIENYVFQLNFIPTASKHHISLGYRCSSSNQICKSKQFSKIQVLETLEYNKQSKKVHWLRCISRQSARRRELYLDRPFSYLISVYLQSCSIREMKMLLSFAYFPGSINFRHYYRVLLRVRCGQMLLQVSSTNGRRTNWIFSGFSFRTTFSLKFARAWQYLSTILATSQGSFGIVLCSSLSRQRFKHVKRQFVELGQVKSFSLTGEQLCVRTMMETAQFQNLRSSSMVSLRLQGEKSRSMKRQELLLVVQLIYSARNFLYCSWAETLALKNSSCDFSLSRSTSSIFSINSLRILSLSMTFQSQLLLLMSSLARDDLPLPGISKGMTTYLRFS